MINQLNYHHLRYFHAVAHAETLTAAADAMNVSQSALSAQIRMLEDRLGHPLFARVGRRLELTEVGRIVLGHADRIFDIGGDLVATLEQAGGAATPLRIGAISTLSRNFQLRFLAPVLGGETPIVLRSGSEATLMAGLDGLELDVVLVSEPPRGRDDIVAHQLASEPVMIHGKKSVLQANSLADLLATGAFIVPSETTIRARFIALGERMGVSPHIVADVDDMAMVRLLAREGAGLAVAPAVVVADELAAARLETAPYDLGIEERFYAITRYRQFPHPLVGTLLA